MQNQKDKTISTRFASDSNPHDHGKLGQLRMKTRTTTNWKTYTKQSKHNTHQTLSLGKFLDPGLKKNLRSNLSVNFTTT
jgi:hypothetical protein